MSARMKLELDEDGFDVRPHGIDNPGNYWWYEGSTGIEIFQKGGGFIGTITWRAIRQALKHKDASREKRRRDG